MKPISNKMLGMTATLYTIQSMNEDREQTWSGAVTLNNVYITATKNENDGAQGKQPADIMTLYYDAVNSSQSAAEAVEFDYGQRIDHDGRSYYIHTIKKHYAGGALHHYELGLV